jgi:DNA-binding MarR family transcriptional regulator
LVSRALPAMRNKGLIEMRQNPEDGREMLVAITAQGSAAFELAAPTMQSRRQELSRRFTSSELDQFVEFLDRLDDFLRSPADILVKKNELNK